jgi:ubiquinol-cytochrome c reductase cytochrome b subunit
VIIISHVLLLHVTGSGNPLGMEVIVEKVPFHPYYTVKDLVGVFLYLTCFIVIVLFYPTFFIEGVNYLEADDMDTPLHIVPEWYFLFAYSILRSVPNKTGGVVLLMFSVFILLLVPFINVSKFISMAYYPFTQFFFWSFFTCFALLG